MVARSAYTQLHYSPAALVGCVVGLTYAFLLPVLALFTAPSAAALFAAAACVAMVRTYAPMVRYLSCHPAWALTLPLAIRNPIRRNLHCEGHEEHASGRTRSVQ
jgi:hypothetical protein